MGPLSPLATATVIALAVCLAGIFINGYKRSKLFMGYEEIADDVRRIARQLKAEVFRDGQDVVVSGGTAQLPTVLRFSHAENTPGMNLRVHAPVTFTFSLAPKGSPIAEGKVAVRTGHDGLDARFGARTDHPTQIRMLLADKKILRHLEKLCCSSRTFLAMSKGAIELSELMIPEGSLDRHVLDHVESISEIVKKLHEMPGAETVNIAPVPRDQTSLATKAVVAAGALAALIVVFVAATSSRQADPDQAIVVGGPEGINPAEAIRIPALDGWRATHLDEFSPDFLAWIHEQGSEAGPHIVGNFSDSQSKTDSVYVLTKGDYRRVVILVQGRDSYDSVYTQFAGIASVPHDNLQNIQWQIEPAVKPAGDAIMLVGDAQNPASGQLMFLVNGHFYTGNPKDYRSVALR
ncbi:MAG TPA: hypothetical protein VF493_02105 [Terriglobales bacterium]